MIGRRNLGSIVMVSMSPASVGHVYRVTNHAECFEYLGFRTHVVNADAAQSAIEAVSALRAVVVFRPMQDQRFLHWRESTKARGVPLLADLDDITFDVSQLASGEWHYWQSLDSDAQKVWRDRFESQRRALEDVDGVLVTTEPLAKAVEALGCCSWIWPNGFGSLSWEISAFQRHRRKAERQEFVPSDVVIGYASGTPTHQADFSVVASALGRICLAFPYVRLSLLGAIDPADYSCLRVCSDKIQRSKAVPYCNLSSAIARFDVNLAPLQLASRFCQAKSELKFFEAAAVGVPSIASPTSPFKSVIKNRVNGFLASSEEEWFFYLSELVSRPKLRRRLGRKACQTANRLFSPMAQVRCLESLLRSGMLRA